MSSVQGGVRSEAGPRLETDWRQIYHLLSSLSPQVAAAGILGWLMAQGPRVLIDTIETERSWGIMHIYGRDGG